MLYAIFIVLSFSFYSKSFTGSCLGKPISSPHDNLKQVVPFPQQKKQQEEPIDLRVQLRAALDVNHYNTVKTLLKKYPSLAVAHPDKTQEKYLICYARNIRMAGLFRKAGCDLREISPALGYVLLRTVIVSSTHDAALIEYYVDNGADPNYILPERRAKLEPEQTSDETLLNGLYHIIKPYIERAAINAQGSRTVEIEKVMDDIAIKTCALVRAGGLFGFPKRIVNTSGALSVTSESTFPWELKWRLFTDFCNRMPSKVWEEEGPILISAHDCMARAFLKLRQALIKETKDVKACKEYVLQGAMMDWNSQEVGGLIAEYLGHQQDIDYETLENQECFASTNGGQTKRFLSMPETGVKPCHHMAMNQFVSNDICWGPCKEVFDTFGLDLSKHPWRYGKPCAYPTMSSCPFAFDTMEQS